MSNRIPALIFLSLCHIITKLQDMLEISVVNQGKTCFLPVFVRRISNLCGMSDVMPKKTVGTTCLKVPRWTISVVFAGAILKPLIVTSTDKFWQKTSSLLNRKISKHSYLPMSEWMSAEKRQHHVPTKSASTASFCSCFRGFSDLTVFQEIWLDKLY